MRHARLLLACMLGVAATACTRAASSPPTPDAISVELAPPAAPASGFHIALIEGFTHARQSVEVCPVRGRTFLCPLRRMPLAVTEAGVVRDPGMEKGWPHDFAAPVEWALLGGRWPGDAWLRVNRGVGDTEEWRFYWSQGERWTRFAEWDGNMGRAVPWGDGLLVEGMRHQEGRNRFRFVGPNGAVSRPPLVSQVGWDDPPADEWDTRRQDFLTIDGALFLVSQTPEPSRLLVERWTPGTTQSQVEELAPSPGAAQLWAASARDVVVYGAPSGVDEQPILRHFDGTKWSRLKAPPGVDVVAGYARTRQGVERAFAFRGDQPSLWERSPAATGNATDGPAWHELALPALATGETLDRHWVTDDDVWLRIADREGRGRILRMSPVAYVYHLGADGEDTTEPVALASPGVPAAIPPPPPAIPAPDPSPFHVALVDNPDDPMGELPRSLALCPMRGKSFVCNAAPEPLLVTDDGIVASKTPLPSGILVDAVGSWPDDAWFVTTTAGGILESDAFVLRQGRWVRTGSWHSHDGPRVSAPWRGGLLLGRSFVTEAADADEYELRVFAPGQPPRPGPISQLLPVRSTVYSHAEETIASAGGALFLVAAREGKVRVERWVDGKAGSRVDTVGEEPEEGERWALPRLWVAGASDAVVYGDAGVLLSRFDGVRWAKVALPAGTTRVAAYDRTAEGRERVFVYAGERLVLFERGGAGEWEEIVLPRLAADEHVERVWLANEDAWLLVWNTEMEKRPARLMRMKPVKKVWAPPRRWPRELGW